MHSRPDPRPTPAIIPAPGASFPYTPFAASWPTSRNGEPGSSSRVTRSRGSSLPRATWRSRCLSGPPRAAAATLARSSSASARLCAANRRKVSEPSSSLETISVMPSPSPRRRPGSQGAKTTGAFHPLGSRPPGSHQSSTLMGSLPGRRAFPPSRVHRLLADQIAIDADHVDAEQDDVLGADPLRLVRDEAPGDERDRGSDEDHERPAGRPPPEVERDDQGGDGAGDRAVPFEAVDQAL